MFDISSWDMTIVKTGDELKTLTVQRDTDAGALTVKVSGPAVLTISDRILHPVAVKNGITPDDFAYPESEGGRYASLKGIMQAKKKPIDETTIEVTRAVTPRQNVIEADDEVFFIAAAANIQQVMNELRRAERPFRRIIIAGGGNIGKRLATVLQADYRVKVIERDLDRARAIAEDLESGR